MEVESERRESSIPENFGNLPLKPRVLRSKTGLRLRYEAEVTLIQKQIGSLEKIRTDLHLSARKICQLLMIDPSAWNRWTRPGATAPPHIWRALQWYLSLQEKIPGLTPNYFLHRPATAPADKEALDQVEKLHAKLQGEQQSLLHRMASLETRAEKLAKELEQSQRTLRVYEMAGTLIALMSIGFVIFLFLRSRG